MTNNNKEPQNAWDYATWLYISGRLTAEECVKLKGFLVDLEDEIRLAVESENCGC